MNNPVAPVYPVEIPANVPAPAASTPALVNTSPIDTAAPAASVYAANPAVSYTHLLFPSELKQV